MSDPSQITNILPDALGGAAGQVPVVLLMWYMLKDIRNWMPKVDAHLEAQDKVLAGLASETVVLTAEQLHQKERIAEMKQDHKEELRQACDRIAVIERELKAVWGKIGSRESDRS